MERPVDELGEGSRGELPPDAFDAMDSEADSCIAGRRSPTTDTDHRAVLPDVRLPEVFDALHEIEEFLRRNPWPMLALGFLAGYLLSRNKAR